MMKFLWALATALLVATSASARDTWHFAWGDVTVDGSTVTITATDGDDSFETSLTTVGQTVSSVTDDGKVKGSMTWTSSTKVKFRGTYWAPKNFDGRPTKMSGRLVYLVTTAGAKVPVVVGNGVHRLRILIDP
ncbi:hypothetical protein HY285_01830 [Candidatus Peregrinibacteria bacterium]|nr:hypothetical protein [Candidatus Peregrinibacteria bacterium]MBI3816267.1 hypothetical protein [Candidatus Peregrinibacteria bacterium]